MKSLLALLLLLPLSCLASLEELIGTELVGAEGQTVDVASLDGKLIGLYFSAEWCPPCTAFTPSLVKLRDGRSAEFEVVFVSSDRSADAQTAYMKNYNMQWPAIPHDSPKRAELKTRFDVSGIPALVIVDSEGNLVSRNGRREMGSSDNTARQAMRDWKRAARRTGNND